MNVEVRNGWTILLHPAFKTPFDALVAEVMALKKAAPGTWRTHPKAKLLQRLREIVFEEIPRDPDAREYRQGNTLGTSHRHWRRVKFLQRFRLFFRFDSATRILIIAWVNDDSTLRKGGARTDPYVVFLRRLAKGDPPDDWPSLIAASVGPGHV